MATGPAIALNVKLNAPANISSVANQIRQGLGGINANVKLNLSQGSQATLNNTNAALREIRANLARINSTSNNLGPQLGKVTVGLRNIGQAGQAINSITLSTAKLNTALTGTSNSVAAVTARLSSFVIVAQTFTKVSAAIRDGVDEALDFQRELIRLKQVGDDTSGVVKSIGDEAIRLGKTLGVSSNELIKVASTLRQAGLSANDTKVALETLAKTRLSPSFTDLNNTVEGAIAVIGQFKLGAKDLERVFDSINSVSKAFAVESNDLITGVRLAGAAFSQAGGDLNEFLAIFTAIRSQTRESAESIGTGLKTIFTRLQRKDSVDALKNLGINLRDAKGQFVGVYEGVRRISEGLSQVNPRSQQFADIVEQIGGLRQVNKILPLINNQKTIQEALNVAKKSSNSLDKDAATGQEILIVKLTKLKESFNEIFKLLSENKQILNFIDLMTKLGESAVFLAKKLEPIIPTLLLLGGLKIASSVGTVASTVGKKALGFNTGGKIPGKSVGDVQPIMAEGGEFMIKRRVAQKIGYDRLEKLNNGDLPGFASGGEVIKNIAASFANIKIGSKEEYETFIKSELDKAFKGQGRPRGEKGYYIKREDFENMVRQAVPSPSFGPATSFVRQASGTFFRGANTTSIPRPEYPQGLSNPFDPSNSFRSRTDRVNDVISALKKIKDNTDGLALNPVDDVVTRRGTAKFINNVGRDRTEELPFDIGLNPSDSFSRNRTSGPVSIPRNLELPFSANLNPDDGSGRYRGFGATIPINPNRGPEFSSDAGLDPATGRARNRIRTNNNIPLIRNPELPFDANLDPVTGRARNRFNTDTSVATNDPFSVIRAQNIGLDPADPASRRRGFSTAALPAINFVAPYQIDPNAGLENIAGKARIKNDNSSSFNTSILSGRAQIGLQRQAAAQARYTVDIPGVGSTNFFRGNDESVNAYNSIARTDRAKAIENFKNDQFGRSQTPYNAGGIDRSAYQRSDFFGLPSFTPKNIGNSGGVKGIQDLFQGRASTSLPKYNKALDEVTNILYKQVQSLQKGQIKEEQYNLIKDTAKKALEANIKVQTNGRGGIIGIQDSSIAQSLANTSFGQRFGAGFAGFRKGLNDPLNRNYRASLNTTGGKTPLIDPSFSGLGSFYADPPSFFSGPTNASPAQLFQGISSDGTVGGTSVAGPQKNKPGFRSNLKSAGKSAAILAGVLALGSLNEQNSGGFFSKVGRVAGQGLGGALTGGYLGGLAGTVTLPGGGTIGGGLLGGLIGGATGIGKGLYDEFSTSKTPTGEELQKAIFDNTTVKGFLDGDLQLKRGGSLGGGSEILDLLTRSNNISAGRINKLRQQNRGFTDFSDGNNDTVNAFLNLEKRNEIGAIKGDNRRLGEQLFRNRLNNGDVTSKNFEQYTKTNEFKQIITALNETVGTPVQELAARNKITVELKNQVLQMEKEKQSRFEMIAVFNKEQSELNKLNFAYSKNISELNRFIDSVGKASERLNENFNDLAFGAGARVGDGGIQSFRFKASDFGEQGKFLEQFAGKGGVFDTLKESLPSIIEASITQQRNNPNISFTDALKTNLQGGGFGQTIVDTIVSKAKGNTNIPNDFLSGKAPEVLNNLLRSFDPFVEGFKKLSAEGEDAGRRFVQGLALYAENVNRINQGVFQEDNLRLGANRELARQTAFDAVNRTSTDFLSVGELQSPFENQQRRLTGLNDPSVSNIQSLLAQRQNELAAAQGRNDPVGIQGAQTAINQLIESLKNLSDVSKSAAGIQEKLSEAEERFNRTRESVVNSTERFINAGPGERRDILRNRQAAQFAAVNGLQNLPGGVLGRLAQNALAGLDELGNQQLFIGNAQVGVNQRRNRAGRVVGRPRAVFAPQFLPANEIKQGLLGGVAGVGLAANNPEIAGLRNQLNGANDNAIAAQQVLNKTLIDTNNLFLKDLKLIFTKFFGEAGAQGPQINGNALNPNVPNVQPQGPPNLQQRRNPNAQAISPFDLPNQKVLNFANADGQKGAVGTFDDMTVAINKLNNTLGSLNIPSEIKITLNSAPINLNLNGMELLAAFNKEIKGLIYTTIAAEFNKRAADFVNNIPPKI